MSQLIAVDASPRLREARPCCGTCNAFKPNAQANPKSGEPRQGWCLASPPVAMPGMQAAPALMPGGQPTMVMQGVWPPTLADRWCRAWEAAVEDEQ